MDFYKSSTLLGSDQIQLHNLARSKHNKEHQHQYLWGNEVTQAKCSWTRTSLQWLYKGQVEWSGVRGGGIPSIQNPIT